MLSRTQLSIATGALKAGVFNNTAFPARICAFPLMIANVPWKVDLTLGS